LNPSPKRGEDYRQPHTSGPERSSVVKSARGVFIG
jgi:hypothetical protein